MKFLRTEKTEDVIKGHKNKGGGNVKLSDLQWGAVALLFVWFMCLIEKVAL